MPWPSTNPLFARTTFSSLPDRVLPGAGCLPATSRNGRPLRQQRNPDRVRRHPRLRKRRHILASISDGLRRVGLRRDARLQRGERSRCDGSRKSAHGNRKQWKACLWLFGEPSTGRRTAVPEWRSVSSINVWSISYWDRAKRSDVRAGIGGISDDGVVARYNASDQRLQQR
jgi:hypothetical protein